MSVFTVLGEQAVLCEKKISDLLQKHGIGSVDVSSYDMLEATVQEALFDVSSLAFLSPKKAVLIRNPDFLTGAPKSSGHDLDAFTAYLDNPSKENILIIYAPYEKLDERKKIVKALRKKSQVSTFETYSEHQLKQWFQKKLQDLGIQYDPRAVDAVADVTGGKIDLMYAEIDKIDLYFLSEPSKMLTLDVVDSLMARHLEDNIFALTDCLLSEKRKKAHDIYLDLLTQNEEPFKLLIMIANNFRLMKQVLRLQRNGYNQMEMAKMLGVNPYRVKVIGRDAHRYEIQKLERFLATIARMDHEIKTGLMDKKLAVELLILTA